MGKGTGDVEISRDRIVCWLDLQSADLCEEDRGGSVWKVDPATPCVLFKLFDAGADSSPRLCRRAGRSAEEGGKKTEEIWTVWAAADLAGSRWTGNARGNRTNNP